MQPPYKFRALQTFTSEETKSTYLAKEGISYTVRPGNHLLDALVRNWVRDGRVEIILTPASPRAEVAGSGNIAGG